MSESRPEITAWTRAAPEPMEPEAGGENSNPIQLLRDRLQNRWIPAIVIGVVLGCIIAPAAYLLAPRKFVARGYIKIQNKLETLVRDVPETQRLDDFSAEIARAALLVTEPRVLEGVALAARGQIALPDGPEVAGRDREAERRIVEGLFDESGSNSGEEVLAEDMSAYAEARESKLVVLQYESENPQIAAAVVNMTLDQYMKQRGPDAETSYTERIQKLKSELQEMRRRYDALTAERMRLLKESPFGTLDLAPALAEMVQDLRRAEGRLGRARADAKRLEDRYAAVGGEGVPPDDTQLQPLESEILADPAVVEARSQLDRCILEGKSLARRYAPGHSALRKHESDVRYFEDLYETARELSKSRLIVEMGGDQSYGAILERIKDSGEETARIREEVNRLNTLIGEEERLQRNMNAALQDEQMLAQEVQNRERESDSIKRGRYEIEQWASAPVIPASDKRLQLAAVGFLGGFGLSFLGFFLVGTVDPRAFRESQLRLDPAGLKPIGVVPDMSDADGDSELRDLASNCVHRMRNKIEAMRKPGDGYAIMVTSPFQGDGKTTVAVALAASYAEAGHRTVLVDCDFIGRALSHQFDALRDPGVRESLVSGKPGDVLREVRRNLWLLPTGVDERISAKNLQIGALRRLMLSLRDSFEIIIVDSGPMIASVEAIPVASSCDGAVLAIRRGRSRTRLAEAIRDIRDTGCQYLGIVLNHADIDDCLRYGSISKMSVDVARALGGGGGAAPRNPLLPPSEGDERDRDGSPRAPGV